MSETVTYEEFARCHLRTAKILVAERVEKSRKLLRLEVDLGEDERRQIVAGIAPYYEPEDLIGKNIVIVANLEPRKLAGLESQGMLLAAAGGDGDRPILLTTIDEVAPGSEVG